jgi:alpha-tubulin suppressor-like RCC1 family protein
MNWTDVSAGGGHSMGIKADGTLWAWGWNNYGQLGDGTNTDRNTPVQVGSDTYWTDVSAGGYHSMGIKADGTLWAWGWNNYGQLGVGTTIDKNTPVMLPDTDGDGVDNDVDNCLDIPNPSQLNNDDDAFGNACDDDDDDDNIPDGDDNCPNVSNVSQTDSDDNGVGNACDMLSVDADLDGTVDVCDPDPGCGGCGETACMECDLEIN